MKQCPNCGAQNEDDSRFCTECGKEFPQGNVCPHCGASVNEGDAFCQNCGKNLNALIDEEPVQYEEEEEPQKNKFIPILAALLLLAVIVGGWWYYKSTGQIESTEIASDTVAEETAIEEGMAVDTVVADQMAVDTVAAYDEGAVESAVEISHESYDDSHQEESVDYSVEETNTSDNVGTNNKNDKVYDAVDIMPSFVGGMQALMNYLSENVKYPVIAVENGVQGRVIVQFVVEKDGSIKDVRVAKSVDPSLDKEAVRVIRNMPNWIPGRQDGSPVRVKYNVPVTFSLK